VPRHARRLLAAALLGLLVAASAATSASASLPGSNGRIVFMRFDDTGHFQVWTANPDMTHQVQLTHGPDWDGWFPSWSPDHSRIAFSSYHEDPDPDGGVEIHDVYTMRPDGTDIRKITDSRGYNGKPSWSPDGRWLLFDADRGDYPAAQGIYRIRSNGSGVPQRITTLPAGSVWQELAKYSPDGRRIVFDEVRVVQVPQDDGSVAEVEQGALFTVRPDGSRARRITPWELSAGDADWSPDGSRLVFGARPSALGGLQAVMIVDADGGHLREVSADRAPSSPTADYDYVESFNPAWSPDGRLIVFVHAQWTEEIGFHMGLQVMRPNGTGRRWLSQGEEHQPDWGSAPALR
jgi:Tol biopolymer transport system component